MWGRLAGLMRHRNSRRQLGPTAAEVLETRALLAAPVVTPIADQLVALNAGFTQAVAATDADGDEIVLDMGRGSKRRLRVATVG